jgi:hypothetical protein
MTDVVDKIAAEANNLNEFDCNVFNLSKNDITDPITRLMNESGTSVANDIYFMAAALLVKYVDLGMSANIPKKRILDTASHIILDRMEEGNYDGGRSILEYLAKSRSDRAAAKKLTAEIFCKLCETRLLLSQI